MAINWQIIQKQMDSIVLIWMKFRSDNNVQNDPKKQRAFLTSLAEIIRRLERRLGEGDEREYYNLPPQSALDAAKQNIFAPMNMQTRSKTDFLKYLTAIQAVENNVSSAVQYLITWRDTPKAKLEQGYIDSIDSALTKATKELKSLRSINW